MNIYLHELRQYRKSTIVWSVSLGLLAIVYLSMFPAFTQQSEQLLNLLKSYPEAMLKALNISESLFTLLGFYSYMFTYVVLCGAIQAMNLGLSLLSKETREKTADFLLTKPVKRTSVVTAKGLAALTVLVVTNVVYVVVAFGTAFVVKTSNFDVGVFWLISLSLFAIQCVFLAIGFLISVLYPKIKSIIGLSLGIVFSFFAISMVGSMFNSEVVSYFTPFKYFNAMYIVEHGAYEGKFVWLSIGVVLVCAALSYVIYIKKDIDAV